MTTDATWQHSVKMRGIIRGLLLCNTFDGEFDGVSVGAVGVLDVEEVRPAVLGADLLDQQPRDVTVLPLRMLHHLLGEVAPLQLLGSYPVVSREFTTIFSSPYLT